MESGVSLEDARNLRRGKMFFCCPTVKLGWKWKCPNAFVIVTTSIKPICWKLFLSSCFGMFVLEDSLPDTLRLGMRKYFIIICTSRFVCSLTKMLSHYNRFWCFYFLLCFLFWWLSNKKKHRSMYKWSTAIKYNRWEYTQTSSWIKKTSPRLNPSDPFIISESNYPSRKVSELHQECGSTDSDALKLW